MCNIHVISWFFRLLICLVRSFWVPLSWSCQPKQKRTEQPQKLKDSKTLLGLQDCMLGHYTSTSRSKWSKQSLNHLAPWKVCNWFMTLKQEDQKAMAFCSSKKQRLLGKLWIKWMVLNLREDPWRLDLSQREEIHHHIHSLMMRSMRKVVWNWTLQPGLPLWPSYPKDIQQVCKVTIYLFAFYFMGFFYLIWQQPLGLRGISNNIKLQESRANCSCLCIFRTVCSRCPSTSSWGATSIGSTSGNSTSYIMHFTAQYVWSPKVSPEPFFFCWFSFFFFLTQAIWNVICATSVPKEFMNTY